MPGFARLLHCIGKAAVKHGLRALAGLAPMGGELYDMACDAWADYRGQDKEAELRAALQALAQAKPAEERQAAEQVVKDVAADQPPEVQIALTSYLSQVPAAVRQSLRRPADPTGTTVPGTLALNKPEDLLPFLPARLPRFKPGDCPPGVGDWELVELLGTGGFGEVWKARHATLTSRKPVALKFCLDAAAAGALRNEAQLLDRVMQHGRHPGIVPLLQTYLRADPPCLEYELVEGGDLAGLMQEMVAQGGMSPAFAGQIISRLAKTIAFAHGLNPPIVHRDLKPANILVQRKPDGKVGLRIADFGIGGLAAASVIRQEICRPASRQQTLPSAIRGAYTPIYASPQQRRGLPPDVRDDVHALGVIWHQLLVGDTTAERPGGRGWRKKLEQRGMSAALLDVLESCIEDEPDERPANGEDLAARIEALLKPTVVHPRPFPPVPQPVTPEKGPSMAESNVVVLATSLGTIKAELYPDKAPVTVKNFLAYVDDGFYDGTVFHRVIPNFMIQGGGMEPGMRPKKTKVAIKNESTNGLSNERGTLAMARTSVPDSATAQFFIDVTDNAFLDKAQAGDGVGYCVFGKVTEGMHVVERIKAVKTTSKAGHVDVPVSDVVIESVRREGQ